MSDEETPKLDDQRLENLVVEGLKATSGRVLQCARHAFHHLERAGQIVDIDPEMAMFRAITAEEEAATAVFFSLRQRRYANSEKIQLWSHPYKAALYPFVMDRYTSFWRRLVHSSHQSVSISRGRGEASPYMGVWSLMGGGAVLIPHSIFLSAGVRCANDSACQLEEFAQGPAQGDVMKHRRARQHEESSPLC